MEPSVQPMSALALASNVRVQLEASKDTLHKSERILQNSEAILSADTPRGDGEEEDVLEISHTPIIAQATPQQTAAHSTNVHNDITYAKHYLAQTQERLQHSNKQDPLHDPLDEKKIFDAKEFYNNLESMIVAENDTLFLAVESVDHTTGVLSKSVQEQIKASKDIMKKSSAMMDSLLRSKSVPGPRNGVDTPPPRPQSTPPHPRPHPATPPQSRPHSSTPPHSSPTPPIREEPDDFTHLQNIYRGKSNASPSDTLDKILLYTNSVSSKYRKVPPEVPTNINSKSTESQTDIPVPPSYPAPLPPSAPYSPKNNRTSSPLTKPQFSVPPLNYPRSPSPITKFSFTNNSTTPAQDKTNSRPSSPHVPSSRPRSSSSALSSSQSVPASAARPLFSSSQQSTLPFKHASPPSLPIAELSHLDLSVPRHNSHPASILKKSHSADYSHAYPITPNKFASSSAFSVSHPKPTPSSYPTRPHSTSPIPTRPTPSTHYSATPASTPYAATPAHSRYTPTSATSRYAPAHEHASGSNITAAMALSLSTRERDEYVARIKARNRSAAMTSDSILDRFYSDRIAT